MFAKPRQSQSHQRGVGGRSERELPFEWRNIVERPARERLGSFEERAADGECQTPSPFLEGRPELARVEQTLGRQLDSAASAQANRVAAIEPAADRDIG